jgi:hypothetical protein
MQLQIAARQNSSAPNVNLQQETDGLATLHRSWTQHVQAWEMAHGAAAANAESILARMDALIAKLEAR